VSWFAVKTAEADRGQAAPDAAVNVFMLALSSGEKIGLRAVLAPDRRDELLSEWRGITRTDPQPSKLNAGVFDIEDQSDDHAQVATPVYAVWWGNDGLSMTGAKRVWRFEVRRDRGGWRVWSVGPYPLVRWSRQGRRMPMSGVIRVLTRRRLKGRPLTRESVPSASERASGGAPRAL
jgi:hypothetical protein